MKKFQLIFTFTFLFITGMPSFAQKHNDSKKTDKNAQTERELKMFFDAYAEDLRKHRREEIANRYDTRGYYRMGNGAKALRTFADTKQRYLTQWSGPKSFEWNDLSIEVLSPTSAVVIALFDWQSASGEMQTISYTGVLTKQSGDWRIRVEDESVSPLGYTTKTISGDRTKAGKHKYSLMAKPGASIAAHRHSVDMQVKVISGQKFIVMGYLDTARVQRFDAGSTLVIPANTWHVEWWETETVEEIDIIAPMLTERASPATPRKP